MFVYFSGGTKLPIEALEGPLTWIFAILVFFSAYLYARYGGIDFSAIQSYSGPYGIGVKRIWSEKHSNHILVFYPIAKNKWIEAFKTPYYSFLPYVIFGKT